MNILIMNTPDNLSNEHLGYTPAEIGEYVPRLINWLEAGGRLNEDLRRVLVAALFGTITKQAASKELRMLAVPKELADAYFAVGELVLGLFAHGHHVRADLKMQLAKALLPVAPVSPPVTNTEEASNSPNFEFGQLVVKRLQDFTNGCIRAGELRRPDSNDYAGIENIAGTQEVVRLITLNLSRLDLSQLNVTFIFLSLMPGYDGYDGLVTSKVLGIKELRGTLIDRLIAIDINSLQTPRAISCFYQLFCRAVGLSESEKLATLSDCFDGSGNLLPTHIGSVKQLLPQALSALESTRTIFAGEKGC